MKPYHIACKSTDLSQKTIPIRKGKRMFDAEVDVCNHCKKIIEPHEIHRADRRLFQWHMKGIDSRIDLAIKK